MPRFVIIVPVGPLHKRVERCLASCRALRHDDYVTVLVTDSPTPVAAQYGAVNVVTGSQSMTGPAIKRDAAITAFPDADVYAFLDDDAYVDPDWLTNAAQVIDAHPEADAFGGPGLMPDDQSWQEQLSVAVMESPFGSGGIRYRFVREAARYCEDFPAYNLFIRREAMHRIGGWASELYGGEDTFVCGKLIQSGRKIWYDPELFVYHYRRPIWPKHAWQVYNIGRSRACFIREGDAISMRPIYFLPLVAVAFTIALLALALFSSLLRPFAVGLIAFGYAAILASSRSSAVSPVARIMMPLALLIHHGAYAYGFVLGLVTQRRNKVSGVEPTMNAPIHS